MVFSGSDSESIKAAIGHKFTFDIKVNDHLLSSNFTYDVYENGKAVESGLSVREDGTVQIAMNQTARIYNAGYVGDSYEVSEHQEMDYPQISPADNASVQGIIGVGDEDATADFVNGTPGTLLVSKNLTGDNADYFESNNYQFRFKLEFQVDGTWTVQTEPILCNSYTVLEDGSLQFEETTLTPVDNIFTVEPGRVYMLDESSHLDAGDLYRLTEVDSEQDLANKVLGRTSLFYKSEANVSGWYKIEQTNPANGKAVEGNVKEDPFAVITNTVTKLDEKSVIYKRLSGLEDQIPGEGNSIKFKVERYTGAGWVPAEGIQYFIAAEGGNQPKAETGLLETPADGLISITMGSEPALPRIIFPMNDVKINPDPVTTGTLRITEASDNDPAWGILQGYDIQSNASQSVSMSLANADTFVNSIQTSEIEVEKELPGNMESGETFTFNLYQMTDWAGTEDKIPEGYDAAAHTQTVGKEIAYNVYDAATEMLVTSGKTSDTGEFTLKGGQFARFTVPQNTLWRVREDTLKIDGFTQTAAEGNLDNDRKTASETNSVLLLAKKGTPIVTLHYKDGTVRRVLATDLQSQDAISQYRLDEPAWFFDASYTSHLVINTETFENLKKDIDLYQTDSVTYLISGPSINYQFVWLGNFNSIKKSDTAPASGMNTVTISEAGYPTVLAWTQGNILYWYSSAKLVKMNPNCRRMFFEKGSLRDISGIAEWDASEVTNMSGMFFLSGVTNLDALSGWNTSKVTSTNAMFRQCENLSDVSGIKNWDVSSLTDCSQMFHHVEGVHLYDLSGWKTTSKVNAQSMFYRNYPVAGDTVTIKFGRDFHCRSCNQSRSDGMFQVDGDHNGSLTIQCTQTLKEQFVYDFSWQFDNQWKSVTFDILP